MIHLVLAFLAAVIVAIASALIPSVAAATTPECWQGTGGPIATCINADEEEGDEEEGETEEGEDIPGTGLLDEEIEWELMTPEEREEFEKESAGDEEMINRLRRGLGLE
jgi:hypothetical protein